MYVIEDSELRVSQYVAPKSGVVGVFIGKQRNADSQESVFDLANVYGDALMKSLGFNPNQPPFTFTADCGRFYANISSMEQYDFDDPANWVEATDWLHEFLLVYLKVVSQSPTSKS